MIELLKAKGTYPTSTGFKKYTLQNLGGGFIVMGIAGILSGLLGIGLGALKVIATDSIMKIPFKAWYFRSTIDENKVREKDIRNFIGAMSGDTTKGVFVTTSTYDDSAVKKAHDAHHKIILIDGKKLVELMYQYGVGTQVKNVYEVNLNP